MAWRLRWSFCCRFRPRDCKLSSALLARPAVDTCASLITRGDGLRGLERVVDLEGVAGLFIEIVNENGIARGSVAGSHAVVHRHGGGWIRLGGGYIRQRFEGGVADDCYLGRLVVGGIGAVGGGYYDADVIAEVTVLDSHGAVAAAGFGLLVGVEEGTCLLYTSDAADDLLCVDLGGRRIIK